MPYTYQAGDNYQAGGYYRAGDYYQAGGIFSSIGRFLGGVAKTAINLIPGPVGAVVRTIVKPAPPGEHFSTLTSPASPGITGVPMIAAPGGGGIGVMAPGGGIITQSPLGTPVSPAAIERQLARARRTHPNKSTYTIRGGGTSRWSHDRLPVPQVIEKGTVPVTNRRMNVANPRALRRGLRRARGFAKLARRAGVILHQYRGGGKKKKK